ncbi:hypothetical protein L53_09460 [Hyphomonas sp. L-53-1-40]|uniref:DNA gyrase inhibitor YacG n=1 Tax=Hyphomonas sp. L-53-1-40 TaxID=1207058 RepID=UPI000458E2DC|nr:DNA gyrase inhibitor YacG [Hyphomonas sp. L-53-1-40]KCZ62795.1 hypothetical protein L53_09460 [Hyphomonas sp. L-53-1-40]
MSKPVSPKSVQPKCSQCQKNPISAQYRPFCSKRCADVDLNKWLSEGYAIPGAPADVADEVPGQEMSEDD